MRGPATASKGSRHGSKHGTTASNKSKRTYGDKSWNQETMQMQPRFGDAVKLYQSQNNFDESKKNRENLRARNYTQLLHSSYNMAKNDNKQST